MFSEYVTVARVEDVQEGSVQMVPAGERWYALARVDGTFYALGNDCPHNGGPLGKGRLEGFAVTCPWHGWRWDVRTGRAVWPATEWRATSVPVRIEGDAILLPLL